MVIRRGCYEDLKIVEYIEQHDFCVKKYANTYTDSCVFHGFINHQYVFLVSFFRPRRGLNHGRSG